MRSQFETSLADEIQSLLENHIAAQERLLTVIIDRALAAVLDDDEWQQLGGMPEGVFETEVYNPGTEPTDLTVLWTVDLEALADWGGVSMDVLQEALETVARDWGRDGIARQCVSAPTTTGRA